MDIYFLTEGACHLILIITLQRKITMHINDSISVNFFNDLYASEFNFWNYEKTESLSGISVLRISALGGDQFSSSYKIVDTFNKSEIIKPYIAGKEAFFFEMQPHWVIDSPVKKYFGVWGKKGHSWVAWDKKSRSVAEQTIYFEGKVRYYALARADWNQAKFIVEELVSNKWALVVFLDSQGEFYERDISSRIAMSGVTKLGDPSLQISLNVPEIIRTLCMDKHCMVLHASGGWDFGATYLDCFFVKS